MTTRFVNGQQRALRAVNGCKRLAPKLRHVLLAMVEWLDWDTFSLWPSLTTIRDAVGVSRNTIMRRLDELEQAGAIRITRRGGGGRGRTHLIEFDIGWLEGAEPTLFGTQPTAPKNGPILNQERSNSDSRKVQFSQRKVQPWGGPEHQNHKEEPLPPPRTREPAPDSQPANAGRGRGGDSQSRKPEDTPVATPARPVESAAPSTMRDATQDAPRASEAINASGANPVVEALVALTVPRSEAVALAALPHADLALVAFVAESLAAAKPPPNRPALWIASLFRKGPQHLEGWDAFVAKRRERERRLCSSLIARASHWAHEHREDQVYRQFIAGAVAAIKAQFPSGWAEAVRDGSLHPRVIRPDATSAEVLASLAASCGVDLEIPADTLRMPEARGAVAQPRSQVQ